MKIIEYHRFWRLLFMEIVTCPIITQNYRKLWFGSTFTQTSQNSIEWNAGGRSIMQRRLLLLPLLVVVAVGLTDSRTWGKWNHRGQKSHALRTVHVASYQWASSHGHKISPMKILMVPRSAYSTKSELMTWL